MTAEAEREAETEKVGFGNLYAKKLGRDYVRTG